MRELIQKIKEWLFPITTPTNGRREFFVSFGSPLTPSQIREIISNSVGKFSPNCKPVSITASVSGCEFEFPSDCISVEELKSVVDKTLLNIPPKAVIKTITSNGVQLYPSTIKKSKAKRNERVY